MHLRMAHSRGILHWSLDDSVDTIDNYTAPLLSSPWLVYVFCSMETSRNWSIGQWLTMPTNLVFMGLHFVISKCASFLKFCVSTLFNGSPVYANSLLATWAALLPFLGLSLMCHSLNARRKLQQQSHSRFQSSSGDCSLPVVFSDPPSLDHRTSVRV